MSRHEDSFCSSSTSSSSSSSSSAAFTFSSVFDSSETISVAINADYTAPKDSSAELCSNNSSVASQTLCGTGGTAVASGMVHEACFGAPGIVPSSPVTSQTVQSSLGASGTVQNSDGASGTAQDSPEVSLNGRQQQTPKQRTFRCRHCDFQVQDKVEFWRHARLHIKPDKILECKQCEFVTEYRHHLEYHERNHRNQKPFQCDKCSYKCVNRSMLNSHMKSHTSVCHYRCLDCPYATKYCHSLKTHLRKNGHRAAPSADKAAQLQRTAARNVPDCPTQAFGGVRSCNVWSPVRPMLQSTPCTADLEMYLRRHLRAVQPFFLPPPPPMPFCPPLTPFSPWLAAAQERLLHSRMQQNSLHTPLHTPLHTLYNQPQTPVKSHQAPQAPPSGVPLDLRVNSKVFD